MKWILIAALALATGCTGPRDDETVVTAESLAADQIHQLQVELGHERAANLRLQEELAMVKEERDRQKRNHEAWKELAATVTLEADSTQVWVQAGRSERLGVTFYRNVETGAVKRVLDEWRVH